MTATPHTQASTRATSGQRRTMRADLHSHTHFSRDGFSSPEQFVRSAVKRGLDCVAVSDHNNIVGAREVAKVATFRVIISEEIKSSEGEIIGWFLNDPVPRGLTPEDTVRAIKDQGGLVCVPHPFDHFRRSPLKTSALLRILPDVDAVETFNARTMLRSDNRRSRDFAQEHGKVMSAGSDSHWHPEIGGTYVEIPEFKGVADFLEALRAGRIHGEVSNPIYHLVSTIAKIRWRLGFGVAP